MGLLCRAEDVSVNATEWCMESGDTCLQAAEESSSAGIRGLCRDPLKDNCPATVSFCGLTRRPVQH